MQAQGNLPHDMSNSMVCGTAKGKEQTMSRWIDADALKKDIARLHALNDEAEIRRAYEYNPHVTSTDFEETLVSVFDAIDDAPSIDIELKHGEWKNYKDEHYCTNCGEVVIGDWYTEDEWYDFCPNCGCRMKGADDERGR